MKSKLLLVLLSFLAPVIVVNATPNPKSPEKPGVESSETEAELAKKAADKAARIEAALNKQRELAISEDENVKIIALMNVVMVNLQEELEKLVSVLCICAEANYLRIANLSPSDFISECRILADVVEKDFLGFFESLEKKLISSLITEILKKSSHTRAQAAATEHKKMLLLELINLQSREEQKNALTNQLNTVESCTEFVTQLSAVYEVLMMNFKGKLASIMKSRTVNHVAGVKAKRQINLNEKTPSI
jgi:hypothetical protein